MLIQDDDRKVLVEEFKALEQKVKLLFFSQEINCPYCKETGDILAEVAELSDKISLVEIPLLLEGEKAAKFGIDRAPAIVVTDAYERDSGVVFYGIPAGYEFISLIGAIRDIGQGPTELSDEVIKEVKKIDQPVTLKVFVTPTCPYCPKSVRVAHQMASINEHIRAECVEATEFPDLARKYRVMGVPRTVINESVHLEGAHPDQAVLASIRKALSEAEGQTPIIN